MDRFREHKRGDVNVSYVPRGASQVVGISRSRVIRAAIIAAATITRFQGIKDSVRNYNYSYDASDEYVARSSCYA